MSDKEAINYEDYVLDPQKDVLVPMPIYLALNNVIQEVEKQHSDRIRTDKYAFFHKQTHQKLSEKGRKKISKEKLAKDYYENIDFDATSQNVRVDRDELGSAAVRLLGDFRGVFRHNVDKGNGVLRSEVEQPPRPATVQQPGPELVKDEEETSNEDES